MCVSRRAVILVRSFHEVREQTTSPLVAHQYSWSPPSTDLLKLNFDGGGTPIRVGVLFYVIVMGMLSLRVRPSAGFIDVEFEEATTCLFAPKCVKEVEFDDLVIESDYLQLNQKLSAKRPKTIHENFVGLIIRNIVFFVNSVMYFSWSFFKRGEIKLPII